MFCLGVDMECVNLKLILAFPLVSRKVEGALGHSDPRDIKAYLEQNDISCWIDVERVGEVGGQWTQ